MSDKSGPRFIIFAQGRSGSTALRSLLTNHPDVVCEGELLMRKKFWPIDFIEGKAYRHTKTGRTWGFKLKWWHPKKKQNQYTTSLVRHLHHSGWKIVYLERKNILFQALSTLSGKARRSNQQNNKWRRSGKENPSPPSIDVSKLEDYVESRKNQREKEKEALSGLPYHHVIYERDLLRPNAHQRTLDELCSFLQLQKSKADINFKKMGGGSIGKYAKNKADVRKEIDRLGMNELLNDNSYE